MTRYRHPRMSGPRGPMLLILLVALVASACDAQERRAPSEAPAPKARMAYDAGAAMSAPSPPPTLQELRASSPATEASFSRQGVAPPASQTADISVERKVIRNGTVRIEVPDTDKAVDAVKSLVTSMGGHLASEERDEDAIRGRQATLTCRVPAERLDEMLAKLRDVGEQKQVNLSTEDITEQYVDLAVRLRTQKQLEERLRALLERPSNKLGDLLDIEREIARVRGEIDSMEGRKRVWDNQVALSTLTVALHEPRPVISGDDGGVWATLKASLGEAANNFVRTIAGLIASVGVVLPLGVAAFVAFWALRWLWRRARRHPVAD